MVADVRWMMRVVVCMVFDVWCALSAVCDMLNGICGVMSGVCWSLHVGGCVLYGACCMMSFV